MRKKKASIFPIRFLAAGSTSSNRDPHLYLRDVAAEVILRRWHVRDPSGRGSLRPFFCASASSRSEFEAEKHHLRLLSKMSARIMRDICTFPEHKKTVKAFEFLNNSKNIQKKREKERGELILAYVLSGTKDPHKSAWWFFSSLSLSLSRERPRKRPLFSPRLLYRYSFGTRDLSAHR